VTNAIITRAGLCFANTGSRVLRSRDHFFGLGLGLTVIGLGLGLGLVYVLVLVSYTLIAWFQIGLVFLKCNDF